MNKTHLLRIATSLSRALPCIALLLLVGCGKSPDSTAESADPLGAEHSQQSVDEPDDEQANIVEETVSAAEDEPRTESPAAESPATESPAAQSPADLAQWMDNALNGNTEAIEQSIEAGADVNAIDEGQRTALMLAGFNGHSGTVKVLLDHGAELGLRDTMGRTALMFAATGDNAEAVKTLLDAGAEVNATDTGEGFTALMHAAAEGQLAVVKELLKHDADKTRRDIDGDNAKNFAEQNGHAEVVEVLSE
ncbi:ankyrin repeat domain-containing protein [Allorhodopirellula solitaria]|uniref:Ankyrin repeats (3 copies) n=1 Tax=Allorhodopirellula solitaria TaxID=2527987 RepID=A0A5C5YH55_9BACT|nr:ankyrin repeat domain-containing protein [Allorhodopirellula solitaria]TWT73941.1 Ankyrin repeats (3 copies) [Allorhodopirellula solitaria]